MALQFFRGLRNRMMFCALNDAWTGSNYLYTATLYGGVQATAANITSSWTSYNSNFLVHIPSVTLKSDNQNAAIPNMVINTSGSGTALNSGTASWAILWTTAPSQATIQGATLPSTRFMVVPVSDIFGVGVLRLTSTTITSGNTYTVADFTMTFTGGIS